MVHSIPVEWWRREPAAAEAAPAARAGQEPRGGETAFWALVAFTAVLMLVPQQYFPFLNVIRINLLIGTLAIGAHVFAPPVSTLLRVPTELKLAIALLACAAISIPGSYWRSASVDAFSDFLRVVAVFWLLGQDVCSQRRLRIIFWTLALVCVPVAAAAVNNYRLGIHDGVGTRILGYSNNLASNPNDLALTLNLFLPFTAILALTARRRMARLVAWAVTAIAIAAVFVTFSRGGFLTLAVEAALFILVLTRRKGARVLVLAMVVGALAVAVMPAGYGERMGTIVNIDSDQTGSAQMRWSDTVAAVEFMISHPIVGAGLGQGHLALNELRGAFWTSVHNAYLNFGVDLGLPALLLYLAMVVTSFLSARRIERLPVSAIPTELRWMASGVRISLAGFIVAAFFHPVGYDFYFFYLAGIAVALKTTAARQFGVRVPA
jgi:O-antigen ligase